MRVASPAFTDRQPMTCAIIRHKKASVAWQNRAQPSDTHTWSGSGSGNSNQSILTPKKLCQFPTAAVADYNKLSSLKQRDLIIWQLWRSGVQNTLSWIKSRCQWRHSLGGSRETLLPWLFPPLKTTCNPWLGAPSPPSGHSTAALSLGLPLSLSLTLFLSLTLLL